MATSGGGTLKLLAYDAFVAPKALKDFTAQTGIKVEVLKGGDTGTMVNKAILTAGKPEADVMWGLDNTFLSRAQRSELFVPYVTTQLAGIDQAATSLVPGHEATPVDYGDVCINYDKGWFADKGIAPPTTLEDLTKAAYKGLLVVEDPSTSSPGLAFLLATVARFGDDGFVPYWNALRHNGVKVADSWDTAYYDEFTAGGGDGTHPIVVSYASSPPATLLDAADPKPTDPTTASLDGTCFRQTEFAGILRGTSHEAEARQLIDFMVGQPFQVELPTTNFVYPVRIDTPLPEVFQEFAPPTERPLSLTPDDIATNRDEWIEKWTQTVVK